MNLRFVKAKIRRHRPPYSAALLFTEGLAVGTLVSSGVHFMSTHQDPLQRAVIGILTVMLTLLNSTLNALICMAIHGFILLLFMMGLDCPHAQKTYISYRLTIDFFFGIQYNISGICEFSQICIMEGGNPPLKRKEFCHDL